MNMWDGIYSLDEVVKEMVQKGYKLDDSIRVKFFITYTESYC